MAATRSDRFAEVARAESSRKSRTDKRETPETIPGASAPPSPDKAEPQGRPTLTKRRVLIALTVSLGALLTAMLISGLYTRAVVKEHRHYRQVRQEPGARASAARMLGGKTLATLNIRLYLAVFDPLIGEHWWDKEGAAFVLGGCGKSAIPVLEGMYRHADHEVDHSILRSLREVLTSVAAEDPDPQVRQLAAEKLARIEQQIRKELAEEEAIRRAIMRQRPIPAPPETF